jgi:opacity protein-like surface antigen
MSYSQGSFFKGIGVFLAGTESAHTYKNSDQDKRYINPDSPTNFSPNAYYPRNHTSREYFNWGFGVFAEFSKRENIRWHTEFEYVKKGASEKELIDPFFGTRAGSYSVNKYTYIEWNNYLKFYNPIGMRAHWYFMAGIRLQYLFSSSISAYAPYSSFGTIGFSGDAALGYEFPITKRWSGFTEFHWNPDIIRHKTNSTKVRNRTYELRIGVVYRPRQKRIDDCNAPRYKGPAY